MLGIPPPTLRENHGRILFDLAAHAWRARHGPDARLMCSTRACDFALRPQ